MIRSFIVGAFALMLLAVTPSLTLARELFNHNGSVVELVWGEGDSFVVRYVSPRDSLPNIIRRGTILFEGASPADGSIYGTAYIFSSKCGGKFPYEVRGSFNDYGFRLRGPAPQVNARCRVTGYVNNNNSDLHFTAQ